MLIAALVWYFSLDKETSLTETADQTTAAPVSAASDTAPRAGETLGAFLKRDLPDGVDSIFPRNGIENKTDFFHGKRLQPCEQRDMV